MLNIKTVWITVNRACNLRCSWCYSMDSNFSSKMQMDLKDAKKLVDICREINIDHVTLIGGEPTVYKDLIPLVKYCKSQDVKVCVVTNGIKLSDKAYLKELVDAGVSMFSISAKGEDRNAFIEVAKTDDFDKLMQAIDNLNELKVIFSLSMVLTKDNIPTISKGLKEIYKKGIRKVALSYCYNFNVYKYDDTQYKENNNPIDLIETFMTHYNEIDEATNGKFVLAQSLPACLWDEDFLNMLKEKRQLGAVCTLIRGNGLVFDTDMSILPCNVMYGFKIGNYGQDFTNGVELLNYLHSDKMTKVYNRLRGVPSNVCLDCELYSKCGGGCAVQYTNFTFDEMMKMKEDNIERLTWKR